MYNTLEEYVQAKQKERIRELIRKLNQATIAYDEGCPIMSDEEWDKLYFELAKLEEATGFIYPDSPVRTIYFTTVSKLNKVTHDHPMLSLDKTKDINSLTTFLKKQRWIAMCKMDGLTCSLKYIDGKLISAETRGNGIEGEDITHNARTVQNIPQVIERMGEVVIDGEIICTYKDFEPFSDKYANPRNFAAGSIRLLDSEESHKRKLKFIAWDMIKGDHNTGSLSGKLTLLSSLKFDIVPYVVQEDCERLSQSIEYLKEQAKEKFYPIDGIVFKYDYVNVYDAAGKTDHHFKGGLAYKFYDDTYESKLIDIEWSMSRTGQISPIALFEKINIDGTDISKASLSNLSIMQQTLGEHPFVGQILEISKRNQIIPKIERAKDENNQWIINSI